MVNLLPLLRSYFDFHLKLNFTNVISIITTVRRYLPHHALRINHLDLELECYPIAATINDGGLKDKGLALPSVDCLELYLHSSYFHHVICFNYKSYCL